MAKYIRNLSNEYDENSADSRTEVEFSDDDLQDRFIPSVSNKRKRQTKLPGKFHEYETEDISETKETEDNSKYIFHFNYFLIKKNIKIPSTRATQTNKPLVCHRVDCCLRSLRIVIPFLHYY